MGLNKFLCRYFDVENKGYVTIGDFIGCFICYAIVIGIIYGLLYSVFRFFAEGSFWANPNFLETPLYYLIGACVTFILIFISACSIIAAIYILIQEISNIKIARCKSKESTSEETKKI